MNLKDGYALHTVDGWIPASIVPCTEEQCNDTNLKENENPLVLIDNCFRTLAIVHDRSETLGPMLHDRFETGSPCMTVLKP